MPDTCTHWPSNDKVCGKPTNTICPYCPEHAELYIHANKRKAIADKAYELNRFADKYLADRKFHMEPYEMEFILAIRNAGGRFIAESMKNA